MKFELRNSEKKIKIRHPEEDKTVSSRNLKIRYFEVFSVIEKWTNKTFFGNV